MSLLDELKEKRAAWVCNRDLHTQRMADEAIKIQIAGAMIADLDKAISALTPEGKEALLESQPEPIPTEVRKQYEQDAVGEKWASKDDSSDFDPERDIERLEDDDAYRAAVVARFDEAYLADLIHDLVFEGNYLAGAMIQKDFNVLHGRPKDTQLSPEAPPQEAPAIPEGFIPWSGGVCPVTHGTPLVVLYRNGSEMDCTAGDEMSEFWHRSSTLVDHSPDHDIIAYRVIETGETQSELDSSQIEGGDRVEPLHDRPKLTNEEFESLEKLDDKPSTVFLDQAEAAILDTNEDDASYAPVNNAEPVTNPVADDFAKGLLMESQAKAEHKRFGIFGIEFGGKKTLVEEGV